MGERGGEGREEEAAVGPAVALPLVDSFSDYFLSPYASHGFCRGVTTKAAAVDNDQCLLERDVV